VTNNGFHLADAKHFIVRADGFVLPYGYDTAVDARDAILSLPNLCGPGAAVLPLVEVPETAHPMVVIR
jgi:hypothetical protein